MDRQNRISALAIASGVASEEQIDIWEAITKLLMLTIASYEIFYFWWRKKGEILFLQSVVSSIRQCVIVEHFTILCSP